jgi:hypothetical protein
VGGPARAHHRGELAGRRSLVSGLQLETLASGGANDLSLERALLLTGMYATLAVAAGLLTLSRRDISA